MKDSIQRICIAVVSFCSAFIIYIIVFREWPVVKEILSSLTTLIAAFCGAWFAFSLQNRAKKDEETGRRISKCNQALFILWQQTNNLMLIQKNIIDPCRGLPLAHIAMRPTLDFEHDDTFFDINGLNFLLGTKHHQLLIDLYIEKKCYKTAIRVVNSRSKLHINQIQPRLEIANISEEQEYPPESWEKVIGTRLYTTLQRATEDLISNVDDTAKSIIDIRYRLLDAVKEQFPTKNIFKL